MRPHAATPALAVALAALGAGCPSSGSAGGGECFVDQECTSGEVCGRDDLCWPASEVRFVKVTWTVGGQPATEASCARHPDLYIRFDGNVSDDLGFSPVPCETGQFVVDKLPRPFTRVELGDDRRGGVWTAGSINSATGTVALDLAP